MARYEPRVGKTLIATGVREAAGVMAEEESEGGVRSSGRNVVIEV